MVGADGERMYIKTDANGNCYYENAKGEKTLVSKTNLKQPPVFMNERGEVYIKDKNGKVQKAEVDQFG